MVTEVILRIRPLPPVKRYGSVVFPDFDLGVAFMREVAKQVSLTRKITKDIFTLSPGV